MGAEVRVLTLCARCFPLTGKLQEMIVANIVTRGKRKKKDNYILLGEDWREKNSLFSL